MTAVGTDWLADHTPSPEAARARWASGELAAICTTAWSVVETHDIVGAVDAMLALRRAGLLGPVLVHPEEERVWWLVPPGQAAALDGHPDVTVLPPGWTLHCPPADEPLRGRGWLELPNGSGCLTDPVALGAALAQALPIFTAPPVPCSLTSRTGAPARCTP
ncbi:hypothetical protein [Streptomyces sp. I05A-00742]|uniref:hypothetical protein n=1 Tax=Streptomyces sp. I05A-00742 TaxID=2732853 RepID=UPI0014887327|nr:hypothetical protein [Streptomyces sp. I05A-00742]